MKKPGLQYYIHDEAHALRFELAGSLSGERAQSVYQAWQTALSILGDRPLIVDITFVIEADEVGRELLHLWHQNGVRFIAGSPEPRALVQPFLVITTAEQPRKQSWLHRLIMPLLRRPLMDEMVPEQTANPHALLGAAKTK